MSDVEFLYFFERRKLMLQGKGVSEGIAFGYVKIIKKDDIQISNYKIHDVENELKNFKFALEKLKDEIEEI